MVDRLSRAGKSTKGVPRAEVTVMYDGRKLARVYKSFGNESVWLGALGAVKVAHKDNGSAGVFLCKHIKAAQKLLCVGYSALVSRDGIAVVGEMCTDSGKALARFSYLKERPGVGF